MPERLGQHFLKNKEAVTRIINALALKKDELVIEIGPGRGALTHPLLARCAEADCEYVGIERDALLAEELTKELTGSSKTRVVCDDAVKALPLLVNSLPKSRSIKIVGNIPYYITGALLRVLSELPHKPAATVLMIQREVAERLASEKMSLLSAATRIWSDAKLLFTLPPKDFDPPPKVYSAVIRLMPVSRQHATTELEKYFTALHIIFKQPRKTLLNNLIAGGLTREEALQKITALSLPENTRPHNLSIEQCERLAFEIQSGGQ